MGTILVATAVFAALGYTVFHMIRNKKKGNDCIGCPSSGNCTACGSKTAR